MASRQERIDAIVARERAAGKPQATAISIAMAEVDRAPAGSTTPIYDKAVADAKKKGKKIPTAMD